jgi:hypothetical protein
VSLGVVRGHRVAWTATAGDSARPWPLGDFAASARQLDPARFARDTAGASVASLAALWADALAAAAGRGGTRASPEAARAMLAAGDSLAADPFGATRRGGLGFRLLTRAGAVRLSYVDAGSGRTLVLLGYPDAGAGCVIVSDDERSGVALATQVAQRVAVVEGWPGMRP